MYCIEVKCKNDEADEASRSYETFCLYNSLSLCNRVDLNCDRDGFRHRDILLDTWRLMKADPKKQRRNRKNQLNMGVFNNKLDNVKKVFFIIQVSRIHLHIHRVIYHI